MSATSSGPEKHAATLLPYQAAFVNTILSSTSRRTVMLRGNAGLGKTKAIAFAVGRLLRERSQARALILCPATVRLQWTEMLKRAGATAWMIDRYKFREMLDPSTGEELWPRGAAAVLSDDFAKQPDVRDSLASVHWDLVVVDEVHRFSAAPVDLLQSVGANVSRVVLTALPGMQLPKGLSLEDATVVDWRLDELVDDDGKPLVVPLRPVVHDVRFALSEAERQLSNVVETLCLVLEEGAAPQEVARAVLIRSLHSSPAALEWALRRFTAGHEDNIEVNAPLLDDDRGETPDSIDSLIGEKGRAIAGQALDVLEAMQVDSKLEAFVAFLAELTHVETQPQWICVLTDYLSTLYYVAAEIEGRDIPCALIHGGMERKAQRESLRKFASKGGMLLATRSAMSEGLDLPDVTDLVLYDMPHNRLALQQVFGRFNRFGRVGRLTIHALAPRLSSNAEDLESLRLLHEMDLGQQR